MTISKSEITVRKYEEADLPQMIEIWNQVVEDGIAFPQTEPLNEQTGREFFQEQTYAGIAELNGSIIGLYILHPNNVGAAGISATAHTQSGQDSEGSALVRSWSATRSRPLPGMDFA
jgi:hypothetical protein